MYDGCPWCVRCGYPFSNNGTLSHLELVANGFKTWQNSTSFQWGRILLNTQPNESVLVIETNSQFTNRVAEELSRLTWALAWHVYVPEWEGCAFGIIRTVSSTITPSGSCGLPLKFQLSVYSRGLVTMHVNELEFPTNTLSTGGKTMTVRGSIASKREIKRKKEKEKKRERGGRNQSLTEA